MPEDEGVKKKSQKQQGAYKKEKVKEKKKDRRGRSGPDWSKRGTYKLLAELKFCVTCRTRQQEK